MGASCLEIEGFRHPHARQEHPDDRAGHRPAASAHDRRHVDPQVRSEDPAAKLFGVRPVGCSVMAGGATKYQPQPSVFTNPAGALVSVISTQLEAIMLKIIHAFAPLSGSPCAPSAPHFSLPSLP